MLVPQAQHLYRFVCPSQTSERLAVPLFSLCPATLQAAPQCAHVPSAKMHRPVGRWLQGADWLVSTVGVSLALLTLNPHACGKRARWPVMLRESKGDWAVWKPPGTFPTQKCVERSQLAYPSRGNDTSHVPTPCSLLPSVLSLVGLCCDNLETLALRCMPCIISDSTGSYDCPRNESLP